MFLHATIPQLPACCVLVSTASPSLRSLWHDVLWLSPSHPVTNVDGLSLMPVTSPLSESASCKIFSLHLLSANEVHHPIKPHLRSYHKMSQLQQYFITIPLDRHRSKSALSRHLKCTKCQLYFPETFYPDSLNASNVSCIFRKCLSSSFCRSFEVFKQK